MGSSSAQASAGEMKDAMLQSSWAPLHTKIPAYSIPVLKDRVLDLGLDLVAVVKAAFQESPLSENLGLRDPNGPAGGYKGSSKPMGSRRSKWFGLYLRGWSQMEIWHLHLAICKVKNRIQKSW